jgi:Arc/MetJ-type ribon-helix-helix transcriptional regulator
VGGTANPSQITTFDGWAGGFAGVFVAVAEVIYSGVGAPAMHYEFPPDLKQRVQARLSDGTYQSEDELLRDAMNALDELDREKLRLFAEGNRIAQEQSRLGLSKPLDLGALLQRVEARVVLEGKG